MITISTPASIIDMAELCGARTEIEWEIAREMHRSGNTWSAFDEAGVLLGLFGLYPLPEPDVGEAWFNVAPDARKHMREIIRGIRLTLPASAYAQIQICCLTQAGRRIAASCGFEFVETIEIGEVWKWDRYLGVATRVPILPNNRPKRSSAAASQSLPSSKVTSTNPCPALPESAKVAAPC